MSDPQQLEDDLEEMTPRVEAPKQDVTAAVKAPEAFGAKCPWMVQLAFGARVEGQALANTNDEASAPVTIMLDIDSVPPVSVRVTVCELLEFP